jgi:CRP-like cAMP-binding protein
MGASLLAYTTTLRFSRGDVLLRQVSGSARSTCSPRAASRSSFQRGDRSEFTVATIDAGSVFGEISFLDDEPRSSTIRASHDGEMPRLDFGAFEVLSASSPALATAVVLDLGRILAARLRQTNALLAASMG